MKTHLVRFSMLLLGAAAGWAQNPYPLRADVPFDFNVSGLAMPAGQYLVSENGIAGLITLRAEGTGKVVVVATSAAEVAAAPATAHLVFRRYGDQYFLAETWTPGSAIGRMIPSTKQERLLAERTSPARAVVASK